MAQERLRTAVALNGYGLTVHEPGGVHRDVLPWHEMLLLAETAEETGYEVIFTPEIAAREAFGTLAAFASATSEIRLAPGVVPLRSRDLRTTALGAATLQDLSDGRFILGLGSAGPIEHTRRHLRALRDLLAGRDAGPPSGGPAVAPPDLALPDGLDVPVFLAALGPRMTELAGEVGDGVILNWCTPERVAEALGQIARGAERAGGDAGRFTVSVYVRACLGHDDEHATAVLREAAGQYASMEKYARQFDAMGLGSEAAAAARVWSAGRPEEVPGSLLRAVCVWGPREEALARLAAYGEAGADLVVVYPVPAQEAVSSVMGTLLAASPDPAVQP